METRVCQNCKQDFIIDAQDFDFYAKIKVPPPTFCPECRMIRRFAYRNERTLHRVTSSASGKSIISCFSPEAGMNIVERDFWWGDACDTSVSAREYDFSRPFFVQFRELINATPLAAVFIGKSVNMEYGNHVGEVKNGYLVSATWGAEDILYSSLITTVKNSMDCYSVSDCEFCYEDVAVTKSNRVFFSDRATACSDSVFLFDCKNCDHCFLSSNLRNKQYCFENIQYTKEEYLKKVNEYNLSSYKNVVKGLNRFAEIKKAAIHRYANNINSDNVTGDNIRNCSNVKQGFFCTDVRDSRYIINTIDKSFDIYDGYGTGVQAERIYESVDTGDTASNLLFCIAVWNCYNVEYSLNCHNSNDLFGCVGLRKKQYCIFNKQYTKEQYEVLVPKIRAQMNELKYVDSAGRSYGYGEFFPIELSPYTYNETIAQDYAPLSKEYMEQQGWLYREVAQSNFTPTIKSIELPDDINQVTDDVLKEIISCATCDKVYRIMPEELGLLRRFGIALPRSCFNCRHLRRFHMVNFPRLYTRLCSCVNTTHDHIEKCANTFETSYAPDRPEKVYCESCYQKEVL